MTKLTKISDHFSSESDREASVTLVEDEDKKYYQIILMGNRQTFFKTALFIDDAEDIAEDWVL